MKKRATQNLQVVTALALLLFSTFGGAGRLDWVPGWIFIAEFVGGMTAAFIVLRKVNPDLIQARSDWRHSDTKRFDRFILAVYLPVTYLQPAIAGVDAARFHWSKMPATALPVGVAVFAAATVLMAWSLAVNQFAEPTVRIQVERGHRPIVSGPYGLVRHPMYAGAILMHFATALILESYWALAAAGFLTALLVLRTALEDRTLQRELPGYKEFAGQTRSRLIPGLW